MSNRINRPKVQIFTDGSCFPNPNGPGGWACILKFGNHLKELSGTIQSTTSSRAELIALIEALRALEHPYDVDWTTDSKSAISALSTARKLGSKVGGVNKWVKNPDLILELKEIFNRRQHRIYSRWVRGHDGHVENERCDVLAGEARAKVVPVKSQARAAGVFAFCLHGDVIQSTNPAIFQRKIDGAMLLVLLYTFDSPVCGPVQCAEHFGIEEFGQWMGGN